MDLTKEEMETIINFNEKDSTASVYTFNTALKHRLEKLAEEDPTQCRRSTEHDSAAVEYIVPKRWVKISPPRRVNFTEEQKRVMADRLKNVRSKQN